MSAISSPMRDALAPLLDCARTLRDVDRTAWLAELRKESPTVVTLLEQLLRDDVAKAAARPVALSRPVLSLRALVQRAAQDHTLRPQAPRSSAPLDH